MGGWRGMGEVGARGALKNHIPPDPCPSKRHGWGAARPIKVRVCVRSSEGGAGEGGEGGG